VDGYALDASGTLVYVSGVDLENTVAAAEGGGVETDFEEVPA
jgi:hypothetical protein